MVTAEQSGKPGRKRGRPVANREKLLMGALTCLREKGYAGTTARDLVEASGTNLASIGYHFGSKEALLNEAIAAGMAMWTAAIEHDVFAKEDATPDERLRYALAQMLDRFEELEPLLVSFIEAFPPAIRSPELRESMAAAYRQAREAGREMFERALAENGVTDRPREAAVLSSLIVAIGDGLILQWLLEPGSTPKSDEVVAALRTAMPALQGGNT